MAIINFMSQFAELIESGQKTQTIRRVRERPISVGNTLHLYTGTRTKNSRKIGVGICTRVVPVFIGIDGIYGVFIVDGIELNAFEAQKLIKKDGFSLFADFYDFFKDRYGLPFNGVLIEWDTLESINSKN